MLELTVPNTELCPHKKRVEAALVSSMIKRPLADLFLLYHVVELGTSCHRQSREDRSVSICGRCRAL
jgi:hypothetical protein